MVNHSIFKMMVGLLLLVPVLSEAHLITITATRPFAATAAVSSTATAVFTVTNITSQTNVTVVDQSNFPSGLSVTSSTCGSVLRPKQSCVMNLSLTASSSDQQISTALRLWAQPALDVVEYPINVTVTTAVPLITLTQLPTAGSALPKLFDPIVAEHDNKWLILSGSTHTMHHFDNTSFNQNIYVYDPSSPSTIASVSISSLHSEVIAQLTSPAPEYLQDGDTLYIIGGYYNTPSTNDFTTLQTITAIDIPGMMNAILTSAPITPFVHFNTSVTDFKVTGGQLGKIGDDFYLAYGMDCEGAYVGFCQIRQKYTNAIYQFSTEPTVSSPTIIQKIERLDANSGWRRRDYTLAPFMVGSTETLLALGGPFTESVAVWTNDVLIAADIQYTNYAHIQQANQYSASHMTMYSEKNQMSYLATFGGITTLYWGTTGLVSDPVNIPFGNILDLVSSDGAANMQEYANLTPMCGGETLQNCLYVGVGAHFIPVDNPGYYDDRYILQIDALPQNTPTLVGYMYGGMIATVQNPFDDETLASVTNQVYEVYVTPSGSGTNAWVNITGLY
ncbi:MAG: hypothetical protein ACHQAX_02475 [Gammaproteobacteria bacterium]